MYTYSQKDLHRHSEKDWPQQACSQTLWLQVDNILRKVKRHLHHLLWAETNNAHCSFKKTSVALSFNVKTLLKKDNPVNCQHITPVEKTQSHFYQMEKMLPKTTSLKHSLFFTTIQHNISTQFHTFGRVQIGFWNRVSYYQPEKPPNEGAFGVEMVSSFLVEHQTLVFAKTLWSRSSEVNCQITLFYFGSCTLRNGSSY